jgi:hypothetical protein
MLIPELRRPVRVSQLTATVVARGNDSVASTLVVISENFDVIAVTGGLVRTAGREKGRLVEAAIARAFPLKRNSFKERRARMLSVAITTLQDVKCAESLVTIAVVLPFKYLLQRVEYPQPKANKYM